MRHKLLIITSICLLAITVPNLSAQKLSLRTQTRRALVQMEHDFARAAAEKGTRDAFLEFLADDGVLFQPGPVNGKKWWTERAPRKGLLSWTPIFADVAPSGDLGYTTGPWEFRPNGPDDKPVAFGQYFTIWKIQSDIRWKAVLDRGVTSETPLSAKIVQFPLNDDETFITNLKIDFAKGRAALLKLEKEFSDRSASKGAVTAFESYLADDARLLRQGTSLITNKAAALVFVSASAGRLTWEPAFADIAASGDFGYTYGSFELKSRDVVIERGSYVRVWKKRSRSWQVVIDVMSPDPQA
jgi:ketosteroid isomerase-like protein